MKNTLFATAALLMVLGACSKRDGSATQIQTGTPAGKTTTTSGLEAKTGAPALSPSTWALDTMTCNGEVTPISTIAIENITIASNHQVVEQDSVLTTTSIKKKVEGSAALTWTESEYRMEFLGSDQVKLTRVALRVFTEAEGKVTSEVGTPSSEPVLRKVKFGENTFSLLEDDIVTSKCEKGFQEIVLKKQ